MDLAHKLNKPEKQRIERMRGFILAALNVSRPSAVGEELLGAALNSPQLGPPTPHEIRRELDYLEQRQLIEIEGKELGDWVARLTRLGIDLIEETLPCDPGIELPLKGV